MGILKFQKSSTVSGISGSKGKISSIYMYQNRKLSFRGGNLYYFFIYNVSETKNISLKSIQSAESNEYIIFMKNFQKPVNNWENN